jgi:DHA1 family bicyclomycin/chloramphenicol resistance-like MFS transporter
MTQQFEKKTHFLLIIGPMVMLGALAMDMFIPFVPILADQFATSPIFVQATLNVFMLVMAFGQLAIGPLSDYYGRKPLFLLSAFFYGLGCLACFFTHNIYLFIAARGLQAFGACGGQVLSYASVRDQADGSESQRLFSYLIAMTAVAPIVAPLLGTYLAHHFESWRVIFLFLTGYALFSFIFISLFFEEQKNLVSTKGQQVSYYELKKILTHQAFKQWALVPALVMSGLFLFFAMSSHYIQDSLECSRLTYSIIFSVNAILYSLSSLLSGRVVAAFGALSTIKNGLRLIILSVCVMIGQALFAPTNLPIFLTCIYTCCVSYGMIQSAGIGLALEPFNHNLGLASALIGTIQFFVASLCGALAVHPPIESSLTFAVPMLMLALLTYHAAFFQRSLLAVNK